MMTLEELTSWRVAAIEGKLPEPVRSDRWQPLRAGVVNLWEYDTAEVWYADGRIQLQGANESGKSTLMTLTTLLLLAGEITSHNIDTLGQNDERFRYYVEPTGHALDRRDTSAQKNRGWAWLEFGRSDQADQEADFFTLLFSAETRRADTNMTVSWCTLSGQTRVRAGLSLTTAGLVADPARFKLARETVTTLTREKEDLDKQHAGEEEAQRLATAERETLREQDAYKDAVSAVANARQLAEQASQAQTTAKRSEQRASKAQADVLPAQQRLKEARENLDSAERSVETAADAASAHAADAGLANVTAQHLLERDTARMRQASRLRAAAARHADELIETHSKALGKAEAAAAEATKVRNRLGQAELAAAEKNAAGRHRATGTRPASYQLV